MLKSNVLNQVCLFFVGFAAALFSSSVQASSATYQCRFSVDGEEIQKFEVSKPAIDQKTKLEFRIQTDTSGYLVLFSKMEFHEKTIYPVAIFNIEGSADQLSFGSRLTSEGIELWGYDSNSPHYLGLVCEPSEDASALAATLAPVAP